MILYSFNDRKKIKQDVRMPFKINVSRKGEKIKNMEGGKKKEIRNQAKLK